VRQWRDDDAGVLELVRYLGCLPLAIWLASAHARVHGTASPAEFLAVLKRAVPPPPRAAQLEVGAKVELHSINATEHDGKHGELLEHDAEAQRWAVELSEGGSIRVRAPNLALLSRDDCPPSLHAVVMLSRGKIQESGDGEAADSALRKMALIDTTAIPLDLLSSTERKAVLVLKQHALVTMDDKDLVAIHSLTQLAGTAARPDGQRRSAGDCGGRSAGARGETRQVRPPEACHLLYRPPVRCPRTRRRGECCRVGAHPAHPGSDVAGAAHWGVGRAAVGGGEARGGPSLLGDVRRMCMSAWNFFQAMGGQYQQALGMYEFTLVCALALEGHDSLIVADTRENMSMIYIEQGKHEQALEVSSIDMYNNDVGQESAQKFMK
jgi:hypothetical protein